MRNRSLCGIAAACLLTLGIPAVGQVGGNFDLSWSTINGGGGFSSAGILSMEGTIGQPDAGVSSSRILSVTGGFWYPAQIFGEEEEGEFVLEGDEEETFGEELDFPEEIELFEEGEAVEDADLTEEVETIEEGSDLGEQEQVDTESPLEESMDAGTEDGDVPEEQSPTDGQASVTCPLDAGSPAVFLSRRSDNLRRFRDSRLLGKNGALKLIGTFYQIRDH